jgi:hypothetical protein
MFHPVVNIWALDIAQGEGHPFNRASHDFGPSIGKVVKPEFP